MISRSGATTEATLVAALNAIPEADRPDLRRVWETADWIQVRADRVGDLPLSWLRRQFEGPLLYSLPSGEGGGDVGVAGDRRADRLRKAAADGYDLIELESGLDLQGPILAAIPPERRLISWRGPATVASRLAARFRGLAAIAARYYLLVVAAGRAVDGLAPLEFLHDEGRRDVVAFAEGAPGLWTRPLAPRFGAPLVFGAIGSGGAGDDPDLGRLIEDYGLPALPDVERLYGIVGDPVSHSLSPRLHNAAYRDLGLPSLFLPFQVAEFDEFHRELIEGDALGRLGLPLEGMTVASPHKEVAATTSEHRSRTSARAASANLMVRRRGVWAAGTTDPSAVLTCLDRPGVVGRRAAVVGCGGSGRAVAHTLARAGAEVTLVNRSRDRGVQAATLLHLPWVALADFRASDFTLVVNATPVGRDDRGLPFAVDSLARGATVVDLVYAPGTTPLVAAARDRGATVIDGREVLLIQAMRQFARMTGRSMPAALAAGVLGLETGSRRGEARGRRPGHRAEVPPPGLPVA